MALKRHRHYGTHAVIAYILIAAILLPMPLPRAVSVATFSVLIVFCLFAWGTRMRHSFGYLCEECIAQMPLDPQQRAQRAKPALRAMHLLNGSPRRSLVVSLSVMVVAVASLVLGLTGNHATFLIIQEIVFLYLLVDVISQYTHAKYKPWCPYCNHGGGGGHSRVESPDPTIPQPI